MPLVEGTRTIVDAMRAEGVERCIGMATPSLRDPRDTGSLLGRIVPFMGRTFLSRAYRELLDMSQLVTDSDLDWTIARFTRPTDGAPTGTVRAGYLGSARRLLDPCASCAVYAGKAAGCCSEDQRQRGESPDRSAAR